MKKIACLLCLVLTTVLSKASTPDVLISNLGNAGRSTIIAKSATVFYAAISPQPADPNHSVLIYTSTDAGSTWAPAPVAGGGPGNASPLRIKMVKTLDSIYCFYSVAGTIYVLNVESGVLNQFATYQADEFDAEGSSNHFALFLFITVQGTDDLRRFGSTDGGASWTAQSALVAGNAYKPRVFMYDDQLVLNYYGPLLSDTAKSAIRAVTYTESGAGTLLPGTFLDVVLSSATNKKLFQSVKYQSTIWFFYTESGSSEDIKCKVSYDDGDNYNPVFNVAATSEHEYSFHATYSSAAGGSCDIAYFSASPAAPNNISVKYAKATHSTPTVFTGLYAINDMPFNTNINLADRTPSIIDVAGNPYRGVYWYAENAPVPGHYFDYSEATGLNEYANKLISTYPNPASAICTISSAENQKFDRITVTASDGREIIVMSEKMKSDVTIDVTHLASGIYFISGIAGNNNYTGKLIVSH